MLLAAETKFNVKDEPEFGKDMTAYVWVGVMELEGMCCNTFAESEKESEMRRYSTATSYRDSWLLVTRPCRCPPVHPCKSSTRVLPYSIPVTVLLRGMIDVLTPGNLKIGVCLGSTLVGSKQRWRVTQIVEQLIGRSLDGRCGSRSTAGSCGVAPYTVKFQSNGNPCTHDKGDHTKSHDLSDSHEDVAVIGTKSSFRW